MSSIIEEIKSRLNIVDVASGYIKLEKAGGSYKACCPFHSEKTPSFFISSSRQTYHCFGCNRGGDVISFVEEIEGLDFSGALRVLAERAGVELTRERSETKNERAEIYRALELAAKFYEAVLPKFPDASAYLKERGLTDDTIQQFHIGFAPDEWRALSDFLTKKGISEQAMERAGLIVRSPKGVYDRFRSRIMFPIMDSSGRVIAFSGRIYNESTGKTLGASSSAKYINSPETEIFHKSRILFGLYQAREALRHADRAVLVEGQMDLILSHQAGVKNTVASSGTALTIDHLALIKRFTKNLTLALDADKAGLSATHRAVGLAFDQDMAVSVASIPEGLDPADLILRNGEEWQNAIQGARHVIDFYLELLPQKYTDAHTLRTQISETVIPLVAHLKNTLDAAHFVGRIAHLLHIKEEPIWEEIKKREVVSVVEHARGKISEEMVPRSRRARIARIIKGILLWQEGLKESSFEIPRYQTRFEKLLEDMSAQEILFEDTETLIFEAEARFHGNEHLAQEIEELLKSLEEEIHRELFAKKMKQLKEAEQENDTLRAQKLLVECQEISKKLQGFKGT